MQDGGQFLLGRVYQFGMAVPQNRQEVIRWFDKAGDQGHSQANYFSNHSSQGEKQLRGVPERSRA